MTVFVQPPHLSLEVDAPRLDIAGVEPQRPERNSDLRVPPGFTDARAHVPDAIPIGVVLAPLVRHLRVPLGTRGIGGELIRVPLVVKRIQNDTESVAVAGAEVLLQVVDDDPRGLVVVGEHPEVQSLIVIEHTDLGVVGRRRALARLVLDEAARHGRCAPRRFVDHAIQGDRACRADRR